MRLITPESKFTYSIDCESKMVSDFLREKLVGERTFELDTFLGKNEAKYNGELENNIITFTRRIQGTKASLYPSCKIKIAPNGEQRTIISVRCALSIYWVVFLYVLYIAVFSVFIYETINNFSFVKLLLFLGGIMIWYAIVFGTHLNELKHYKDIFKKRLQGLGEVQEI